MISRPADYLAALAALFGVAGRTIADAMAVLVDLLRRGELTGAPSGDVACITPPDRLRPRPFGDLRSPEIATGDFMDGEQVIIQLHSNPSNRATRPTSLNACENGAIWRSRPSKCSWAVRSAREALMSPPMKRVQTEACPPIVGRPSSSTILTRPSSSHSRQSRASPSTAKQIPPRPASRRRAGFPFHASTNRSPQARPNRVGLSAIAQVLPRSRNPHKVNGVPWPSRLAGELSRLSGSVVGDSHVAEGRTVGLLGGV